MAELIAIEKIKTNDSNPRIIKDEAFARLVKSIKEAPKIRPLKPIIVDENYMVLGGNMRLRACRYLGIKEVYIDVAKGFTEEEKKEFIIKDNLNYGEWDFDMLANEWDKDMLDDFGVHLWNDSEDIDYSALEGDDVSDKMDGFEDGVKKSIRIEFNPVHYEEAKELVKFWIEKEVYVGMMFIEKLKYEKEK